MIMKSFIWIAPFIELKIKMRMNKPLPFVKVRMKIQLIDCNMMMILIQWRIDHLCRFRSHAHRKSFLNQVNLRFNEFKFRRGNSNPPPFCGQLLITGMEMLFFGQLQCSQSHSQRSHWWYLEESSLPSTVQNPEANVMTFSNKVKPSLAPATG